jgi:MFS family permease
MLRRGVLAIINRLFHVCCICCSQKIRGPSGFVHRRRYVLALLTFITCVTNAAFCILFPFYPQEAAVRLGIENLDKTPTGDIGFVLSASSLAYFAFALVSGQWIDSVGVKPVLLWGLSALCLATLLFGSLILVLLEQLKKRHALLWLVESFRIVWAWLLEC